MTEKKKARTNKYRWKQERRSKKRSIIEKIILRDRFFCCKMCGVVFADFSEVSIDHIKPLSKGGGNDLSNLQLCCAPCNNAKADHFVD